MQALFYGIGAAVIGIIARSAQKLTTLTLGQRRGVVEHLRRDGATTAWTEREIVWLFLLAGVMTAASRPAYAAVGGPLRRAVMLAAAPGACRGACRRPVEDLLVLREGWCVCLWQRPRDRAVSVRRVVADAWLAQRSAVSRCCGRGDDHARSGRHHCRVHWLPGRRHLGNDRRGARGVPSRSTSLSSCRRRTFGRHRNQPVVKAFVDGVSAAATGAIAGAAYVIATRRSSMCPPRSSRSHLS